jgi:DNA repair protein RadC
MHFAHDRSAEISRGRSFGTVRNAYDVYRLLGPRAAKERVENAWVVLLDVHGTLRGTRRIARGSYDTVGFELSEALRPAQNAGVRYLVLAHNHPSGSAIPSDDRHGADNDARLTRDVESAANQSGLLLLDHVVLGVNEYYSFREGALFRIDRDGAPVRVK